MLGESMDDSMTEKEKVTQMGCVAGNYFNMIMIADLLLL